MKSSVNKQVEKQMRENQVMQSKDVAVLLDDAANLGNVFGFKLPTLIADHPARLKLFEETLENEYPFNWFRVEDSIITTEEHLLSTISACVGDILLDIVD